jgi:hypothetical protein
LGGDLLLKATKLRWLQAPQAAPPAGYYYPELIAHSVVVTNFREGARLLRRGAKLPEVARRLKVSRKRQIGGPGSSIRPDVL